MTWILGWQYIIYLRLVVKKYKLEKKLIKINIGDFANQMRYFEMFGFLFWIFLAVPSIVCCPNLRESIDKIKI